MSTFERKLLSTLTKTFEGKEFTIISGARQTGKTTLLNQLLNYLQQRQETGFFSDTGRPGNPIPVESTSGEFV